MDVQEKNRIIARYMGYKLITPEMRKNPKNWVNSYWEKKDGEKNVVLGCDTYLRYHTDWNWLMKVVEKISKTETSSSTEEQRDYHYPVTFAMISPENQFMVRFRQFFLHQSDSLIEATFEAAVETIQFLMKEIGLIDPCSIYKDRSICRYYIVDGNSACTICTHFNKNTNENTTNKK